MATRVNGIDVDVLGETIEAVKGDPNLAQCKFRAKNRWTGGTHNVGRVEGFFAAKQEMRHPSAFEHEADEPPILAGDDTAANPVEHLLTALAACLTTSLVAHAAVRGIEVRSVESELEGDIDLNGFFGLSNDVPRGYRQIRVKFTIDSDADPAQLRELADFSPVMHTIVDGAPVAVQVETKRRQRKAPREVVSHP